ncbi:MAG: hypothetical protein PHQ94_01030 [Syntrophomonas sp.]|nr:hypothetical protein [Syntrophomonas sp.]
MICPACNHPIDDNCRHCNNCGFELSKSSWVVITTVSPPDDAILGSLIQSFGIPVRLIPSIGSVFGLSVGPLGEVKIAVPEQYAVQTKELLKAELEE